MPPRNYGHLCRGMWLHVKHAAAYISLVCWATCRPGQVALGHVSPRKSDTSPRKIKENYATACCGVPPHALASMSPTFLGHASPWKSDTSPRKVRKSMPMHMAVCRHMHWHRLPYFIWATCRPEKSCTSPREVWRSTPTAVPAFNHRHRHRFPYLSGRLGAQKSRETYADTIGCAQPHASA